MSHQYKYNLPVTFDGKHSQSGEPEPRSPRYCPMTSRQGQDSSPLPVIEQVWFKKKKKYIEPQTSIKRFFKTRCNLYIQPMLMLSALQFSQKIFYSVRHIQQVEGEDRHSQYAGVVGDELAWHNRWYLDINSFIISLLPICLTLSYGPYKALTQTLVTFLSRVFKLVCVLVISFIGTVTTELSCFKMTWNNNYSFIYVWLEGKVL